MPDADDGIRLSTTAIVQSKADGQMICDPDGKLT